MYPYSHTLPLHDARPIATNYLYRHPGWNVSVGATVDGVPAVGAVVVPAHGDVFVAATGHGATRNGLPLRLRDRKSTRLNSSHQCASRMPSSACKQKTTNAKAAANRVPDNNASIPS